VVGKGEFIVMPPWMIEEANKAEKAEAERRRQEEAARPRVYAPEPPSKKKEPEAPEPRGVFRIEF
jgi:hypothetical protein